MKRLFFIVVVMSISSLLIASSITISPDTLSTTIASGGSSTHAVTITNHNSFPVNLEISILEQPAAGRMPFDVTRFAPEPESLFRNFTPDIQYQDENGNWIDGIRCGTTPTPTNMLSLVQNAIDNNRSQRRSSRNLVNVQVAWHVIHASNGAGNFSNDMIVDQIEVLNDAYAPYDIFFTLVSVDYTMNDNWFADMNQYESAYKQQLNIDPVHHLNIYSGNMPGGLLGWSYMPYSWPENHYMHGVCLLYSTLPGGTSYPYNAGDIATHEVGHYLGLEHTFLNGCSTNNDYVGDTPQENDGNNIYNCNNTDTCPNDPGMDPVHNFMTYTDDACVDEFTTGQGDRMEDMIATYRPGLLENPIAPEWIYTTTNVIQVPANSTVDLDITFDGTAVVGGDYAAHIYFEESTMDTTLLLPSYMHISGITNLELSFESLTDTLYSNEFSNNFLEMTYSGVDILTYEFNYDLDWVNIFGGDGTMENGETQFITFNFNSLFMIPGVYEGDVILNTNMGSFPIHSQLVILEPLNIDNESLPLKFTVSNNFPNPFNPVTTFSIDLPAQSSLNAAVYDLYGRKIATLLHSELNAGSYNLSWQGRNDAGVMVSAGMYFLKVDTEYNHHVQKMIFMK
ncbi:MAG: M43 family zinc metalloprotease [Candidatus Marinimicrobia bacterium]|jgi:hypothetical protein|nr:hypothetical protein [Candidatus Neomarinimicrobiota bacterium]MDP6499822.1 M43 family zinc metalloprotease [Candidatus Neomarinimicrobiota bacterium]|tara:strand:+ start:3185 stop:5050 length:1866 start_codon:yes stop_codon:yes gene_type:complete